MSFPCYFSEILVEGYLLSGQFTLYELMMAGVESSLRFYINPHIYTKSSTLNHFKAKAVFKNRRNCLFNYFTCFGHDRNHRVDRL